MIDYQNLHNRYIEFSKQSKLQIKIEDLKQRYQSADEYLDALKTKAEAVWHKGQIKMFWVEHDWFVIDEARKKLESLGFYVAVAKHNGIIWMHLISWK